MIALLFVFSALAQPIPRHAHAVDHLWKWECNRGYIQNRNECIKVKIPKNGILNEDGHTWNCLEGFEKYRDVCKKEKKN
jgi:hypothetical protein